jgi:hypothetical protein
MSEQANNNGLTYSDYLTAIGPVSAHEWQRHGALLRRAWTEGCPPSDWRVWVECASDVDRLRLITLASQRDAAVHHAAAGMLLERGDYAAAAARQAQAARAAHTAHVYYPKYADHVNG